MLFTPFWFIYAFSLGKKPASFFCGALLLGLCVAGLYVVPLLSYRQLFDDMAMPTHHPYFELGRSLLQIGWSDFASQHIIALPGLCASSIAVAVAVVFLVRASGRTSVKAAILVSILGIAATMIPGVGEAFIKASGLKVTGFEEVDAYSMKMLFTVVLTACMGMISYARLARQKIDPRDTALVAWICAATFFMVPMSAFCWKVLPQLSFVQFPWRICAVLNVAAVGLFAGAMDNSLETRVHSRPSKAVTISFAVASVLVGGLVWRVDRPWRAFAAPRVDIGAEVDVMYPTYVPPDKVYKFAGDLGTSPDTFDVAPSRVEKGGVHARLVSGNAALHLTSRDPQHLHLSVDSEDTARVRIDRLWFPLWKVARDGVEDRTSDSSVDDLIEISSPPGHHEFEVIFASKGSERAGMILSAGSVVIATLACLFGVLQISYKRAA